MSDFIRKSYDSAVTCGSDKIVVQKSRHSEWVNIYMKVNDVHMNEITIRSKEQAEHLHFMLGQMLEVK